MIDYSSLLSPDQKRQVLESQITQDAAQAYSLTLNKKAAEKLGVSTPDLDSALLQLDAKISLYQAELDALSGPEN